jgi:GT2 family glycosyltransferase
MTSIREPTASPAPEQSDAVSTMSVITLLWRNERYAAAFFDTLDTAARVADDAIQLVAVQNGPDGRAAATVLASRAVHSDHVTLSVCRSDINLGFSGGANLGCAAATGEILIVANLDVEFGSSFLQQVASQRDLLVQPGFLVPSVLSPGRESRTSSADAGALRRDRLHRPQTLARPPRPGEPVPAANGSCLIFGRALLSRRCDDVGGLFDQEYHSYYEDVDLFWWAERYAIPAWWTPSITLVHHQGGSFDGKVSFRERTPGVRASVMANYRLTVWRHAARPSELLYWVVGEAGYLTKCIMYDGLSGALTYMRSWSLSVQRIRRITARRGSWR